MLRTIFNLLFPARCIKCRKLGSFACVECTGTFTPAPPITDPDFLACFAYHDPHVRKLLKQLKYYHQRSIAYDFAPYLADRILDVMSDEDQFTHRSDKILLIPVPLFRARQKKRGYNQAEVLAQALAGQHLDLFEVCARVVEKVKDTPSQVSIKNRIKRLGNLEAAFQVIDPKPIRNRNIIIIDDIITTGSTLKEIRKILLNQGAQTVLGLAVAHG